MDLSDLWLRMEARYDTLPPRLRAAARVVRDNPADVALHGLRPLARKSGLSPAALVRLVQAMGLPGWEEFRALHRDWLTGSGTAVFSGRAGQTLGPPAAGDDDSLIDRIAAAETANAASGLRPDQRARLLRAAELLAGAAQVGVLGLRSCHAVAVGLGYSLSLFHPGVRLLASAGGQMLDGIDALAAGDALVVITVHPVSREAVETARHARDRGLSLLCLTDGPLNAAARLSDLTLTAANDGPSHLASVTGLMALAQALASLALSCRGEAGLAALRRREALLAARHVYLAPET